MTPARGQQPGLKRNGAPAVVTIWRRLRLSPRFGVRVSGRFHALVNRNGLDGVRFHDLRHTMALSAGVHVKIVSERLGHAATQITLDTYSHVLSDLQREAAEALDVALSRTREPAS